MSICHLSAEERLERKLKRSNRKIEILEQLIEDQSRLIHERSEELESAVLESSNCRVREGLLTALIENANEGIFAIDPQSGLVIETNATAAKKLGYTKNELRQANIQDIELKLETHEAWEAHVDQLKRQDDGMVKEGLHARKDGSSFPVEVHTRYIEREGRNYIIACTRDITQRKQDEARLQEAREALLEASRKAGMADVASSILHNVGNVLNSLIVNAAQLDERIQNSEIKTLIQVKGLIESQGDSLEAFVRSDPKSVKLLHLVARVARALENDQNQMTDGLSSIRSHLDHVRSIVARQQKHARAAGIIEELSLENVLEDAIEISCGEFTSLGIRLVRSYLPIEPVRADRHKVLEVLVNLLSNAKHAVIAGQRTDKMIEVILSSPNPDTAHIIIKDNGVGLDEERARRVFEQGFTTKPDGNGLGLHASAIAARQMNGSLSFESAGFGFGASFCLSIPTQQEG